MCTLELPVRYFQDSTPEGVPCREEHFIRRELIMVLPVEQTALVLVDVWNVLHIESWLERAKRVTREAVGPALATARQGGLTIVHAPSPEVAGRYPQLWRHAPPPRTAAPDWPPVAFRRREGEYAAYRGPRNQPPGIGLHWDPLAPHLDVAPEIEMREEDFVVATGQQLHELLRDRGVLHLLYAGFCTNWCVLGRDYGIRAMGARGYNVILLRDATMSVEFPDTLDRMLVTEIAIREVEQQHGFTASTEDLLTAVREALYPSEGANL